MTAAEFAGGVGPTCPEGCAHTTCFQCFELTALGSVDAAKHTTVRVSSVSQGLSCLEAAACSSVLWSCAGNGSTEPQLCSMAGACGLCAAQHRNSSPDSSFCFLFSLPSDIGSNNCGYYDLQAVLTHQGRSSSSGHYVSWVKRKQGKKSTQLQPSATAQLLPLKC